MPYAAHAAVQTGLPIAAVDLLQEQLGLSLDQLATHLGIGRATLHRRRQGGRLTPAESDRVLRWRRIFEAAREVLGGEDEARAWLAAPQTGLGGERPLEFAMTEVGAREVEQLLGRMAFGVYS